jgi:hypothetical protein
MLRKLRFFLHPQPSGSKAHHQAGADAEVVLVVVSTVIECSYEIVCLDEAHRETPIRAQVEASAEIGGEGSAGIGRGWVGPLNKGSAGVRHANERLAEGLQGRAA